MKHWITCSVAGCSMSIGAVTRGLGWGGGGAATSPLSSIPMDALMATILLIQNSFKLSAKISTGFLGKGTDCFLPRRVLTTVCVCVSGLVGRHPAPRGGFRCECSPPTALHRLCRQRNDKMSTCRRCWPFVKIIRKRKHSEVWW